MPDAACVRPDAVMDRPAPPTAERSGSQGGVRPRYLAANLAQPDLSDRPVVYFRVLISLFHPLISRRCSSRNISFPTLLPHVTNVRPWPVPQSKHNSRLYKIGGPVGHGHDYNEYDRTDDGVTWMLGESVDVSPSRPPQLSHLPSPVAPPRTTPGAGPSGSAPVDADDAPPVSGFHEIQDPHKGLVSR